MFKDVILGYYRSPSMGKKIQDYKIKLKNDLKWWIFNIFAIVFVFFTIFLTNILPSKTMSNNIVKKTSLNPNLAYNVKSTETSPKFNLIKQSNARSSLKILFLTH